MIGMTLGHYRILERLGAGGMGEVYRAHDERLDRDVAIKVLSDSALADPAGRARLLREARSGAALNHPHICAIYEVGEADGRAYIAMELVHGESLAVHLSAGALSKERALSYGLQIAEALAHAHERGMVHRDLKSANVVITPEGVAKVLDFGLAKKVSEKGLEEATTQLEASLTAAGAVVGTLPYMAPEQFRGLPADARSDVWALGVVLQEMATGKRPFSGQTGFELSAAILSRPPDPLPDDVPAALKAVIERCLEKEPARRYQRGGEVRAALEASRTATTPVAPPRRQVRHGRTWLAVAGGVSALLAVMVALDVFGLRSRLTRGSGPQFQSLAVLPLQNLSGDASQDYFADGMTEALITDLARLKGLKRVIARGSVTRFKGTTRSLSEVARELQVDALVTGAVLRSGDRVRLTAQLVDGATEAQIWGSSYERELRDILALQGELTSAIAGEIRVKLTPAEQARAASARHVDPEAYEEYLKGRFHYKKNTPESTQTALEYYQRALDRDPDYALAWAGIGLTWLGRGHLGFLPPREALERARGPIEKAIQLDDSSGEVHAIVGGMRLYLEWDWLGAEKEIRRAIELNPGFPDAHQAHADLLLVQGRREQALEEARRALELDPLNYWMQMAVGGRLLRLGRWSEGLELLRRSAAGEPTLMLARRYLWIALHHQGRDQEAVAEARNYFDLVGWRDVSEELATGFARGGYAGAMRPAAQALEARARRSYVQGTQIAALYAYAGDKTKALEWLENAYDAHDSWLVFLMDDPRFETLRAEPGFLELLRRMKFPDRG